jgi:hypothetical protein
MIHDVKNTASVRRKSSNTQYHKKYPKFDPAESISAKSRTHNLSEKPESQSQIGGTLKGILCFRGSHPNPHLLAVRAIQPPTPRSRAMSFMMMVMMSMGVLATCLATSVAARIESPHRTTVLLLSLLVLLLLLVLLMLILQHISTNSSNHTSDDRAKHSATDLVS